MANATKTTVCQKKELCDHRCRLHHHIPVVYQVSLLGDCHDTLPCVALTRFAAAVGFVTSCERPRNHARHKLGENKVKMPRPAPALTNCATFMDAISSGPGLLQPLLFHQLRYRITISQHAQNQPALYHKRLLRRPPTPAKAALGLITNRPYPTNHSYPNP